MRARASPTLARHYSCPALSRPTSVTEAPIQCLSDSPANLLCSFEQLFALVTTRRLYPYFPPPGHVKRTVPALLRSRLQSALRRRLDAWHASQKSQQCSTVPYVRWNRNGCSVRRTNAWSCPNSAAISSAQNLCCNADPSTRAACEFNGLSTEHWQSEEHHLQSRTAVLHPGGAHTR